VYTAPTIYHVGSGVVGKRPSKFSRRRAGPVSAPAWDKDQAPSGSISIFLLANRGQTPQIAKGRVLSGARRTQGGEGHELFRAHSSTTRGRRAVGRGTPSSGSSTGHQPGGPVDRADHGHKELVTTKAARVAAAFRSIELPDWAVKKPQSFVPTLGHPVAPGSVEWPRERPPQLPGSNKQSPKRKEEEPQRALGRQDLGGAKTGSIPPKSSGGSLTTSAAAFSHIFREREIQRILNCARREGKRSNSGKWAGGRKAVTRDAIELTTKFPRAVSLGMHYPAKSGSTGSLPSAMSCPR